MPHWAECILLFAVYSLLGWICESTCCSIQAKKFINRGFLNGPFCPIYGVGALLIIKLLAPFSANIIVLYLASLFLTSILEYFTGFAMEKLFHAKWWDYSNRKFNINGRVCLRNSLLFGVMALALMYLVHPFVERIISRFSPFWLEVVATSLAVLMIADLVSSTLETLNFKNKLNRVSELATSVTDDLKEKGVETKGQLTQKIADVRSAQHELLETAKDDVQKHVEEFTGRLSEKAAFRRYSHSRIINAFPNMISKDDPDSLNLYREAMLHTKKIRKLHKKAKKQAKKSQEK